VAQQVVGQHRREVLVRGGHGEEVQGLCASFFRIVNTRRGPVLPSVDQALGFQVRVVEPVDVAVRGLLAYELRHRFVQQGVLGRLGQQLGAVAHRVDKRLFADRKAHGQGVVVLAHEGVAAIPVALKALAQVDLELAHGQTRRAGRCRVGRGRGNGSDGGGGRG